MASESKSGYKEEYDDEFQKEIMTGYEPLADEATLASFTTLYLQKLLKKYENNCLPYFKTKDGYQVGVVVDKDRIESGRLQREIDFMGKIIYNCLKKNPKLKVIAIPIAFSYTKKRAGGSHQNVLIYRVNENTFDLFEPLGGPPPVPWGAETVDSKDTDESRTKLHSDFESMLENSFKIWETKGYIPEGSKFENVNNADCAIPQYSSIRYTSLGVEYPDDYMGSATTYRELTCQFWSLLYLEYFLKYPDMPREEIIYNLSDKPRKYFSELIAKYKSYLQKIGKESGYKSDILFTGDIDEDEKLYQEDINRELSREDIPEVPL
jgi:hypothetical protein